MLILVVEDEADIRESLVVFAAKAGWTADAVASGEEALAYLKKTHPDIVVSDFNMPRMTGIQLLNNIRKDGSLSGIPFALMTGGTDIDERGAKRAGCNGFLAKPFGLRVFQELLGRFAPR